MKRVKTTAHRGYPDKAPENTLISFRLALEYKPDYIECDVHRTLDGEIVVMHDGKVDRTTNGSGQISELNFHDIHQLDAGGWFHSDFAGEQVPLLSELLDLCHDKARLKIEVKDAGIEDDVYKVIERTGMLDQVMVISFHASVGIRMKVLNPKVPFARLLWSDHPILKEEAEKLVDALTAGNASTFGINYQATTSELVEVMHGHNIKVSVWTVDDRDEIRRMAELGVDIITSNDIDLLTDTLAKMN
ncbi:MAG: glycerophosphodiester phosphodiesterase [Armatimonadota bacterium]